jgi:flagellar biogenesis protein FliO
MGLAALLACVALGVAVQDPAPTPAADASDLGVTLPPALPARAPAEAAADPAKSAPVLAIPVDEARRVSKPLVEEKAEPGPSIGGFMVGSFAVVGFLGVAFLLLRRFGRNSRFLGTADAIRVIARKPLAPKQEIFLVEVGTRVFMIGSTRDRLSTLGEFAAPDEVALLRANLPERREATHREFSQSLREGLRDEEKPREDRVFASIADELAEIRKTVRAWRA